MIKFNNTEVESIIKAGNGNNDIQVRKRYYDSNIYEHITKIENSDIKPFLDYQFNENEFQFSFVAMLYYKSNQNFMPDKDKRELVMEWLRSVIPVNPTTLKTLFEEFLRKGKKEVNEESVIKILKHKNTKDIASILDFAMKLSIESINLHRESCTNIGCNSELNFERRVGFIEGKKKEIKGKGSRVDINKIEWLGTQKQLAELFVELKNNAWIEDYNKETIKVCFTKSNTIQQVLKPNTDTSTGNDDYDGIYTTNYDPMFHGIAKNKKPSK